MKTTKMSLANIQGKLSRTEMKNIMAGLKGAGDPCNCNSADDCTTWNEMCIAGCEKGQTGKAGKCGCSTS